MTSRRLSLIALLIVVCFPVLHAQTQGERLVGTLVERAPLMLLPESGRTPLATLDAGKQVQVLAPAKDGWYKVSFRDTYLLGTRVGYIRVEQLQVAAQVETPLPRGIAPAADPNATTTRSGAESTGTSRRRSSANPDAAPRGMTEAAIAAAIEEGSSQKGVRQGLQLADGRRVSAQATGNGHGAPTRRLLVQIHTPLAWVRQMAGEAALKERRFAPSDVTAEMRQPVLRVSAYTVVETDEGTAVDWARHVVLRNIAMNRVVQPLSTEAFSEHVVTAAGGRAVAQGLHLTFSMDALRQLRGPRGDAEFFVTVVGGSGEEKNLRVTKNQFIDLPM